MLSTVMHTGLLSAFAIQPFTRATPDIVKVNNASADIRVYVHTPIKIANTDVHHPLLLIEKLAYFLSINTNILRLHDAVFALNETVPIQLRVFVTLAVSIARNCVSTHLARHSLLTQCPSQSSSVGLPH